jgi:hypothetical protein
MSHMLTPPLFDEKTKRKEKRERRKKLFKNTKVHENELRQALTLEMNAISGGDDSSSRL